MRGLAPLGRIEGSVRQITAKTTAPTGRLTKKTHCHPMVSVMNPPIAGQMSELSPHTAEGGGESAHVRRDVAAGERNPPATSRARSPRAVIRSGTPRPRTAELA